MSNPTPIENIKGIRASLSKSDNLDGKAKRFILPELRRAIHLLDNMSQARKPYINKRNARAHLRGAIIGLEVAGEHGIAQHVRIVLSKLKRGENLNEW